MQIRTVSWAGAPTPRRILYIVGVVLVAGGLAVIPAIVVSLMYQEGSTALHLGVTALATAGSGGLIVLGLGRPERLRPKDSFAGVALAWVTVIFFGSLPYLLSGSFGFTHAMFESTAGFTTTGATTIENWNRQLMIIPNRKFITEDVINWTRNDDLIRTTLDIGVAYGTDTEKVIRVLVETVHEKLAELLTVVLVRVVKLWCEVRDSLFESPGRQHRILATPHLLQ